jgi:hypothetical protein
MTTGDDDNGKPLLPLRTALILLLAVLCALGATGLVLLADRSGAEAALVGCGVLGAAVKFCDWAIG